MAAQHYIAQAAIWPRMQLAQEYMLHETFTLHSGGTLLTGRIPLAFLEGGKWVMADFSPGGADHPPLLPPYEGGLGGMHSVVYARLGPGALALEQLTPFPVRDLLLFVVDRQREIRVAWESPGKDAVRKQLLG